MQQSQMQNILEQEQISEALEENADVEFIKPKHDDEEDTNAWIMSFADMVTLLMCFFILFFSTTESTPITKKTNESLTERLHVLMGYSDDGTIETDQLEASGESAAFKTNSSQDNKADVAFAVGYSDPDTVEIVLLSKSLFKPGGVDISSDGRQIISDLSREIGIISPQSIIEIEGHTDSDPIKSKKFRSNWELSTARAASVAHVLMENKVKPERIKVAGFAHYQPIAQEFDSRGNPIINNKSLNRRIVVKLKKLKTAEDDDKNTKQDKPTQKSGRKP